MRKLGIAVVRFVLVLGLGFLALPASSAPALNELSAQASGSENDTKPGKKRTGDEYDRGEFQVERSTSGMDEVDRVTLKMRAKQPVYFLGVPMLQIPNDNWLMSELIYRIKPDYIIEAGTYFGASALYYSSLLELVNPTGKVITVDINDEQIKPEARNHELWKRRVMFIKGSSTDSKVIERIRAEIGTRKKVLVTLDTLHAPNHVSRELELYSPFVSKRSYLILQDTFYEGVPEALDRFLATHAEFRRDTKLDERFLFTKYRGGFLQRK